MLFFIKKLFWKLDNFENKLLIITPPTYYFIINYFFNYIDKRKSHKKNKLIILDNASSHRNAKIKELVNKHNTLLYSVPYQHFTNSIENYFSMMKSKLYKLDGLTHSELKANITKVIKDKPSIARNSDNQTLALTCLFNTNRK